MTAIRKGFLALALLGVAAVLVTQPWSDDPADRAGAPSNQTGQGASGARVEVPVVDLGLSRLTAERGEVDAPDRNPFEFRPAPPPPPPPRDTAAARPDAFAPPPPQGPPPPPPIPLKFFGLGQVGGTRVAWFSDARGNIIQGKEGDIIEGRYRLIRIAGETVDMAYLDGRGRQTIRLSGQ
jgi:hypothetical protein